MSRKIYEATYENFMKWKEEKKAPPLSENVLLAYFAQLQNKYLPSTLWSKYSMIRSISMLKVENDVDISKYAKLVGFIL